ncbi:hypothetical protein ACFQW4_11615 [Pantoea sp. GCM10028869]|uniref:hypothetical protein n=1 Tax=Pantoea sp. GCM10028869 TaxID=3273417 RepID=UPI003607891A
MKISVMCGLLMVALSLGWIADHYHSELLLAEKAEHEARKELQRNQSALHNAIAAVVLFHDIARITQDNRLCNFAESEMRVVRIRKELREDSFAHQPVPAVAADQLRAHRERIRAHSRGTNTTRIAGGL